MMTNRTRFDLSFLEKKTTNDFRMIDFFQLAADTTICFDNFRRKSVVAATATDKYDSEIDRK